MSRKKTKPKIGETVYVVYWGMIIPTIVGWLGKEDWIPENFQDIYDECMILAYKNIEYIDPYGRYLPTWFFTLEEAKKELFRQKPDCKDIKLNRWFWEAVYE